jgi:hypothetical protein
MQLASVNPTAPFVPVSPLPAKAGDAPKLVDVPFGQEPKTGSHLVSVRYKGHDTHGDAHQLTVRDTADGGTGEYWYQVSGSFDDAVRAARDFALAEGETENPAAGEFARSSVAVLDAGNGVWQLQRMMYLDGMGDGMDPIISMPIDAAVTKEGSSVSVPFGDDPAFGFTKADSVSVRFDDPRVKALVGVDSIAVPAQG